MTQEEKSKAYDEALELMKDCIPDENGLVHVRPDEIFHELNKESEDEKIRKKLIDTFNFYDPAMNSPFLLGIHRKDIIAWLEKQGQVKESEISQPIKETSKENDNSLTKKAWSEEDDNILNNLIDYLKVDDALQYPEKQVVDWLKQLKQRIGG